MVPASQLALLRGTFQGKWRRRKSAGRIDPFTLTSLHWQRSFVCHLVAARGRARKNKRPFSSTRKGLLEVVWVILGVERVEYTHYCRLSCIPRGR
jgi:hypothetical protein